MSRTRVTFDVVSIRRTRRGACSKCGQMRQRTKQFLQTINPFNKTITGAIKDREQIMRELRDDADLWMLRPIVCASCEVDTNEHQHSGLGAAKG